MPLPNLSIGLWANMLIVSSGTLLAICARLPSCSRNGISLITSARIGSSSSRKYSVSLVAYASRLAPWAFLFIVTRRIARLTNNGKWSLRAFLGPSRHWRRIRKGALWISSTLFITGT
ncbi:MAG: hypothetical protein [Microviridae sp.]|nr:MAG: hypothetical protein [Microviridae sp.]